MNATLSIEIPLHLLAEETGQAGPDGRRPVLLALHGYAMTAEHMLPLVLQLAPEGFLVIALEGPFSTLAPDGDAAAAAAASKEPARGYHWGVSPRNDENRAVHRASVAAALDWAAKNGGDPARVSLLAFSQPCSFDYRLALSPPHGQALRAVVGLCGGVPGEWLSENAMPEGTALSKKTAALHVSTRQDPFYPADKAARFEGVLAARFGTAVLRLHDGGHRVPKDAFTPIREFLSTHGLS